MGRLLLFLVVAGLGFGQPTRVVYEQIFDAVEAVPTTSDVVSNVGQGAHFIVFLYEDNDPNVCAEPYGNPVIEMQYSYDGVTYFSNDGNSLFSRSVVAPDTLGNIKQWASFANTYPYIRFRVTAFDVVNCELSGWYSGMTDGQKVRLQVAREDGVDDLSNASYGLMLSRNRTPSMQAVAPSVFDGEAWDRLLDCEDSIAIVVGAATTLELVPLADGESIRVCSFSMTMAAAGTAQFVEGTGANCAAGTAVITGAYTLGGGFTAQDGDNIGRLFTVTEANALCLVTTGGGATAAGLLTYAQY